MILRRPLCLLLAGVLSATGAGCATYTAVTASSPRQPATAERFVSIGRTFENQGRYDQAELMYSKALRLKPADETIQRQLQQLADRRAGRDFGTDSVQRALAMADAVSGHSSASDSGKALYNSSLVHLEAAGGSSDIAAPGNDTIEDSSGAFVELSSFSNLPPNHHDSENALAIWEDAAPLPPTVEQAEIKSAPTEQSENQELQVAFDVSRDTGHEFEPGIEGNKQVKLISMEQLLGATENLDQNADLVIQALTQGEDTETKTLAAALLGDCQTQSSEIAAALATAIQNEADQGLLLAIADSQTQRGVATDDTVQTLLNIARDNDSEYQVQAVSSLRYFATSGSSQKCQQELTALLTNSDQHVRAAAVLTLGDFEESAITMSALRELAADENDEIVREAALAAIQRKSNQATTVGRSSL